MRRLLLTAGLIVLCGSAGAEDAATELMSLSTGGWTSREQSVDPNYDWVESDTVRILADRTDGVWMYQENTVIAASPADTPAAGAAAQPYFQVVIQLRSLGPDKVLATTYRLASAQARSGASGLPDSAARPFDPAWIGEVACMNQVQRVADGFWHSAAECPNNYKGAVRIDSRSVRTQDSYVNWDRGFDGAGRLIWGPPGGGYIFKRRESAE